MNACDRLRAALEKLTAVRLELEHIRNEEEASTRGGGEPLDDIVIGLEDQEIAIREVIAVWE